MKRALFIATAAVLAAMVPATSAFASTASAKATPKVAVTVGKKSLSATGGAVTIRAKVHVAGACTWAVSPKIKSFDAKVKCKAALSRVLHIPANTAYSAKRYTVKLTAGKFSAKEVVTLDAKKLTLAVTAPTTSTPAPAPVTTTAATSVVALAASIDPSYVQSSTDPYEVTWTYSASAQETSDGITQGDPILPDGVLELFSDGSLVQSSDVGGSTTSASATVTYSSWGDHTLDVVYDSGTSSGTTGTETYDVEPPPPPPITVENVWASTAPTNDAAVSAYIDGSSDSVTVTDDNFEGAQSVTLTDNNGNECTATVSGTTATCAMNATATPTSFTVAYPGGTTTQTTQTIDPWGEDQTQDVTEEWPAESVRVDDPTVDVQQATMEYVEILERNAGGTQVGDQITGPWPSTIDLSTGYSLAVSAEAAGSLVSDAIGQGDVPYDVSPSTGVALEDMKVSASTDCSGSWDYSDGVDVEAANGDCRFTFSQAGTYTITIGYDSSDSNYSSIDPADGLTLTVEVSS